MQFTDSWQHQYRSPRVKNAMMNALMACRSSAQCECTGSNSAEGKGAGHVHSIKASGTFSKVGAGDTTHNTGTSAPQYSASLDAWLYALHCMCMTRHWSSPFENLEHT